jgi:predicted transcriptional regulator
MSKKSASFMVASEKVRRLDALVSTRGRDHSVILDEAIDLYLDLDEHHGRLIKQGIADAYAGRVISHEGIGRALDEHVW